VKEINKNWKSLGYAQGPLQKLKPSTERSFGAFFTVLDGRVQIGFVIYIGKSFVSVWWLK